MLCVIFHKVKYAKFYTHILCTRMFDRDLSLKEGQKIKVNIAVSSLLYTITYHSYTSHISIYSLIGHNSDFRPRKKSTLPPQVVVVVVAEARFSSPRPLLAASSSHLHLRPKPYYSHRLLLVPNPVHRPLGN